MKVLVVYHTTYGHTLQLARAVEAGVKSVAGIEAVFRRAPEFPHVEKENSKQATATPRKSGRTKKESNLALSMTCAKPMDCCSVRRRATAI